jgi:N utilization substance protein B
MRKRTKARQYALQILYKWEIRQDLSLEEIFTLFWQSENPSEEVKNFAQELVRRVIRDIKKIDQLISEKTYHWDLNRLSIIDRNVLRLGIGEFLANQTPRKVVINEAINLAKKYGTEDSGRFVNGILDNITLPSTKKEDL